MNIFIRPAVGFWVEMCVYCEKRLVVFVLVTIFKMDDVWHLYFSRSLNLSRTSQLFHGEIWDIIRELRWILRRKFSWLSQISNDQKVFDVILMMMSHRNIYSLIGVNYHIDLCNECNIYSCCWAHRTFDCAKHSKIQLYIFKISITILKRWPI